MNWLTQQLAGIAASDRPFSIILDPDGVAARFPDAAGIVDQPVVGDWVSLRRLFMEARKDGHQTVVIVQSTEFRERRDLPWDIDRASRVTLLSWPVPPLWRDVLVVLATEDQDALVRLIKTAPAAEVAQRLLSECFSVVLPSGRAGEQFAAAVSLRLSSRFPQSMWPRVQELFDEPLAQAIASDPPRFGDINNAWADWLKTGPRSKHDQLFRVSRSSMAALFASGVIEPAAKTADDIPSWAGIGVQGENPIDHIGDLLGAFPETWPPETPNAWFAVAGWWGEVRAAAAAAAPAPAGLQAQVDSMWEKIDLAFQPWLRAELGGLMLRQTPLPLTLNQVAPFLARRVSRAPQLLIVIDGMGFAQWMAIRAETGIDVKQGSACFAMCPTLTSISRQAIFAGDWPSGFPDSLWTTSRERERWLAFWEQHGVARAEVGYAVVRGDPTGQLPPLAGKRVFGMVITAVDQILHGADVLADAQVDASTRLWARHGFLESVLRDAQSRGYETWIVSDHGNIAAEPAGRIVEGLKVEQAGTRVRVYENAMLRASSRAHGNPWDPPGMPRDGTALLFAPGRTGYHSGGTRVTHGGLSLDEAIVPFLQVEVNDG